ncbi:MAG: hypothetical protein IKL37_03495 [Alphaproteobacteria bacterium]|nr:hypothetical protein [Alphaproteobacteria bacterium]
MLIIEIALGIVLGVVLLYLICIPEFLKFLGGLLLLGVGALFWSEIIEFIEHFVVPLLLVFFGFLMFVAIYKKIKGWLMRDTTPALPTQEFEDKEHNSETQSSF